MSKEKYHITTYPEFNINYWAIPKSGNTTVKYCFLNPNTPSNYNTNSIYKKKKSVHNKKNIPSITVEVALNNKLKNFTVTRHPYDRMISLYKDFGLRRPWRGVFQGQRVDLDDFIYKLCIEWNTEYKVKNHHAFSQSYYVTDKDEKNLLIDEYIDLQNLDRYFISLGITPKIYNKTKDLDIVLSEKHKEMIYNRYKKDFVFFNYKK